MNDSMTINNDKQTVNDAKKKADKEDTSILSVAFYRIDTILQSILPKESFEEVSQSAKETGIPPLDIAVSKEKLTYEEFADHLKHKFNLPVEKTIEGKLLNHERNFFITTDQATYTWYPPYVVGVRNVVIVPKDVFDDYERRIYADTETVTEAESLFNEIIKIAFEQKASDIHIEPLENSVRVLLRIQQDRVHLKELSSPLGRALINYIKSECNKTSGVQLDENRIPQDGRLYSKEINLDMRVNFLPTLYRLYKITIRLLYREKTRDTLETLGFLKESQDIIKVALRKPYGLILVVGGTGSGKSRTLSTMLSMINRDRKCVVSIEDPVEYPIYGVTQGQYEVWEKNKQTVGYNFSVAARAFMRADPDVCLIGEIRDPETASSTVALSNTGHLVLSTLHTNLSSSAPMRMIYDPLRVSPTVLASELMLVIGQKLVKKLCRHCRRQKTLEEDFLKQHFLTEAKAFESLIGNDFYTANPDGCGKCREGYSGVTVVEDVLVVTEEIRKIILERDANRHEIQKHVRVPFSKSIIEKSEQGIIDLFNAITVIPEG